MPGVAQRFPEAAPDKMKDFMDEDALEHPRGAQHSIVEDDLALAKKAAGVDRISLM